MSGLLAHERGGPALAHQVLIYPGVDISGRYIEEHGAQDGARGMDLGGFMASVYVDRPELLSDPRCSPWLAKDVSFMPPALVMTAEYCFIRDQGEAYAKKLAAELLEHTTLVWEELNSLRAIYQKEGTEEDLRQLRKALASLDKHCNLMGKTAVYKGSSKQFGPEIISTWSCE